jgi:methyl-accepting chemotaxis protein/methyl-accepting chemotaxis protein-1 (serine sensor receptor)
LIEESIDKSKDGRAKLDQVIGAVRSITESATKVKTLVDEVEIGSKEQARGIEQVSNVIMQMETVTQATAAQAEESAAAGEELSGQAEALRDIVVRLEHMLGATS